MAAQITSQRVHINAEQCGASAMGTLAVGERGVIDLLCLPELKSIDPRALLTPHSHSSNPQMKSSLVLLLVTLAGCCALAGAFVVPRGESHLICRSSLHATADAPIHDRSCAPHNRTLDRPTDRFRHTTHQTALPAASPSTCVAGRQGATVVRAVWGGPVRPRVM